METIICKDNDDLSERAADIMEETLAKTENPVFGLATGSTPVRLYEILIERCKAGKISFQDATSFNLDEYVGLAGDDVNSYRYFMDTKLFRHIDIKHENTNIPDGLTKDPVEECKNYEEKIKNAGKVDVQILGLGLNGHIGFNEPGTDFESRTRVVKLDASTREANARFFNSVDEVPTQALTMGIASIMDAKKIILLVSGEKKATILREVINGEVTKEVPASILQRHPDVTILTDINL